MAGGKEVTIISHPKHINCTLLLVLMLLLLTDILISNTIMEMLQGHYSKSYAAAFSLHYSQSWPVIVVVKYYIS